MATSDDTRGVLVPDQLAGTSFPWNLTDPGRRGDAAREIEPTPEAVTAALDALDRCRLFAAAHPDRPDFKTLVDQEPLLKPVHDAWPALFGPLTDRMPTLPDVTDAALRDLSEQRPPGVPDYPALRAFAKLWTAGLVSTLALQASDWLRHHVQADTRTRYLTLLADAIPVLPRPAAASLVYHLVTTAGPDAGPYLRRVADSPDTPDDIRASVHEHLEDQARRAHPYGSNLPVEIWRLRGSTLARARRGQVVYDDGETEDQLLELGFSDGSAVQLWAAYDHLLRVEPGHYEGQAEDRLAADITWRFTDDPAAPAGSTLDDFTTEQTEGVLSGLTLLFGTDRLTLAVVDDLVLHISWRPA